MGEAVRCEAVNLESENHKNMEISMDAKLIFLSLRVSTALIRAIDLSHKMIIYIYETFIGNEI